MTQQTNIAAAFLRLSNASTILSGRIGTLGSLTTTEKNSLVTALNEVKASIPVLSSIIDDSVAATSTTWSSSKIQGQITAAISALISDAPEAQDTLGELAAQITALAQADGGLLSFSQPQTLTAAEKLQAGQNLGIGDPAHDYLPAINTALAGTGL